MDARDDQRGRGSESDSGVLPDVPTAVAELRTSQALGLEALSSGLVKLSPQARRLGLLEPLGEREPELGKPQVDGGVLVVGHT